MKFPFLTRSHHEDVTAHLLASLDERDERIASLEEERKRLIDYLAENSIGNPIFRESEKPEAKPETAAELPPPPG